jgi:hypothetical protein
VEVIVGDGVSVGEGVNVGGMPVEVGVNLASVDVGVVPCSDGAAERARFKPSLYAEGFGFRSPEAHATSSSATIGMGIRIRDKTIRPFMG